MEEHFSHSFVLLLSSRRIAGLKLYLSINLIIVPHPVRRASSWGIVTPYITPPPNAPPQLPPSSLLSILLLLYVYADDVSKHFSPARRRQA